MIRYKKYQVTGEDSPLKGLWYARPVIEETFDIEKLAKHMSNHNTPYSSGVIKGVLADMVSCTKELILDGKNVKLDDLAIFSVGIVSKKGAQSAADFSLANNVKGLKLRARATGELSNAQINLDGQLKESSLYTVGGKAHRLVNIKIVNRFDQANAPDLKQVVRIFPAPGKLLNHRKHQAQIPFDQFLARLHVALLCLFQQGNRFCIFEYFQFCGVHTADLHFALHAACCLPPRSFSVLSVLQYFSASANAS